MPNTKTVKIFCEKCKGIVHPSPIFLECGEEFNIKAVNTNVILFFPKPEIFENGQGIIPLDSRESVTLKVKECTTKEVIIEFEKLELKIPGIYPYAVYCENINDFAEGNSSPSMIIED